MSESDGRVSSESNQNQWLGLAVLRERGEVMLEHDRVLSPDSVPSSGTLSSRASSTETPSLGPAPGRFIGYRAERREFRHDPIGYLTKINRDYGLTSAWGPQKPALVFTFDPALNQIVCDADHFDWAINIPKRPSSNALDSLNAGLLRMNGEAYKARRRMIRPVFNQDFMDVWQQRIANITCRMLDDWGDKGTIDWAHEIHNLVLAISLNTVFNVEDPATVRRFDNLLNGLVAKRDRMMTFLLPFDLPGSSYRRMLRAAGDLVSLLRQLIRDARKTDSMIGMLIESRDENGEGLSESEIVGEAFTLMNHDNLIGGLTWTFFLLVMHPQIHADVLDELHSVLRGGQPTLEQATRLPLLERVIKEGLRLMPIWAVFRRYAARACRLGPFDLAKGSRVIISPYITHRLPSIFADPNRFMPERWEKPDLRPTQYEYFPFGAGSHSCLGTRFALLTLKIVLASVVQRYRLMVTPDARIDRVFRWVIEPRWGIPMLVNKQDRQFVGSRIRGNIHEMVTFPQ
jgi:cytochrome P450